MRHILFPAFEVGHKVMNGENNRYWLNIGTTLAIGLVFSPFSLTFLKRALISIATAVL